jgi:GNAT superfamily N-acetyltransferase
MTATAAADWTIRLARAEDREAVLVLVPRLRSFGSVPLRSAQDLDAGESRTLNAHFDRNLPESARLWVAEAGAGSIEGVAYAERLKDYFTQETHGHLGVLVVAETAEGRGIAKALIQTVESWSRSSGFRFLTLNVFAGNERARAFYERAAFRVDTVRYVKPL